MGLDITAYSRLKHIGKHTDDWCEDEDHVQAYAYDSFPQSFRGIPVIGTREGRDASFLVGGCYEIADETKTVRFRAGSYMGYGRWRDDLRAGFNPGLAEDRPFFELIWFADNEGSIGPEAAEDLLADFRENESKYMSTHADEEGYRESYAEWATAFELASDSGLVSFG